MEMGEGGAASIPQFIRGFAIQRRRRGEVREIGGSDAELIPKGGWRIARQSHRPGFSEDRPMNAFRVTILS
jgi:hypothetical protein